MSWASIASNNPTQEAPIVVKKTSEAPVNAVKKKRVADTRVRTNLICTRGSARFEEWDEQFFDHCHDLWMMLRSIADDHHLILDTDDDNLFQEFRHFIYTKSSKYITLPRNEF